MRPGTVFTGGDDKVGALGSNSDWSGYPYRVTTDGSHLPFALDYDSGSAVPVLSSPPGAANGADAYVGSVVASAGSGTLYRVGTSSATRPSAAQVRAGLDHAGAAAAHAGNQTVVSAGTQNVSGPATAGSWYLHYELRRVPRP